MGVAKTAIAALGHHRAFAHAGEIGQQGLIVLVEYLGADRDLEHHVRRGGARPVLAHAVTTGLGLEVLLVAVVDQGVEAVDAFAPPSATAPAVATVRPAELDEFLAPERDAAGAAVAGTDEDFGLVEKFHGING